MAQGNLWGKKITVTLFTVTLRGQYRIKLEITVTLCKARPGAAHGAESRPGGPGPGRKINNSSGGGRALPKPNLLGRPPSGRAERGFPKGNLLARAALRNVCWAGRTSVGSDAGTLNAWQESEISRADAEMQQVFDPDQNMAPQVRFSCSLLSKRGGG